MAGHMRCLAEPRVSNETCNAVGRLVHENCTWSTARPHALLVHFKGKSAKPWSHSQSCAALRQGQLLSNEPPFGVLADHSEVTLPLFMSDALVWDGKACVLAWDG